jgi:hypothetical protein
VCAEFLYRDTRLRRVSKGRDTGRNGHGGKTISDKDFWRVSLSTPPGTRTLNPRIKRSQQIISQAFAVVRIRTLPAALPSRSVQGCSCRRDLIGIVIGIVRPRRGLTTEQLLERLPVSAIRLSLRQRVPEWSTTTTAGWSFLSGSDIDGLPVRIDTSPERNRRPLTGVGIR